MLLFPLVLIWFFLGGAAQGGGGACAGEIVLQACVRSNVGEMESRSRDQLPSFSRGCDALSSRDPPHPTPRPEQGNIVGLCHLGPSQDSFSRLTPDFKEGTLTVIGKPVQPLLSFFLLGTLLNSPPSSPK